MDNQPQNPPSSADNNPNYQAPQEQVVQPEGVVVGGLPTQPTNSVNSPAPMSETTHYYINQEFKFGRETFSVTDGQNLICVAKKKLMSVKEHIDVYRDEAATQLLFTIDQTKAIAISKVYEVVTTDGQKLGSFKLEAMQSMLKEHWDILDANNNPIGVIDQDTMTAMAGRFVGGMGNVIPQSFTASINNQPVCTYHEEINVGMFFKMDIDFSSNTAGLLDKNLGIAGAILLSTKHMETR